MTQQRGVPSDCVVLLYGSRARGDADAFSDADVLVLSDRPGDAGLLRAIERLAATQCDVPRERVSVSSYSFKEMRRMACAGSLFARHIAAEAQVMAGEPAGLAQYQAAIDSLTSEPYVLQAAELRTYWTALADIEEALDSPLVDYPFELVQLRTLLRHLSVLASALCGVPTFGRTAAFDLLVAHLQLPASWARDFQALFTEMVADRNTVELWVERTHHCAFELQRICQEGSA